jgi:PAS domain S-box-containing protein
VAAAADGDYGRPIPVGGPAELADLSRSVELMRTVLVSALAQRKRAEDNLRRLFELTPDAMIWVAEDGSITMVNAQAARLFGVPAGELVGKPAKALVPEGSRAQLTRLLTRLFEGSRPRTLSREIRADGLRADGGTFQAGLRLSLLPTDHGPVLIAAIRDVTEQVAAAAPSAPDVRGHGEVILLVEDEESPRAVASRILTRNGYQVQETADAADAVRRAADPAQRIDLVVTDMVLAGMLGSEVVAQARAIRPRLPAVFITGHPQHVDYHGLRSSETDVVQKPFSEADLLGHVRRALNRSLKQATIPKQAPPPAREKRLPWNGPSLP